MTTKPFIQIGEEVREMTDAEYAQWQLDSNTAKTNATAQEQLELDIAKQRASALTKLEALGLTAAEILAITKQ